MPTEQIYADGVLANNGCVDPANAQGASDAVWTGNTGASWDCRWSMTNPSGDLTALTTQFIRVRCRKSSNGGTNPTIQFDLYESGSFVKALFGPTAISSTTGSTVSGTFVRADLSDVSGAGIEVLVTAVEVNRGLQLDYIEHDCTYNAGSGFSGAMSAGSFSLSGQTQGLKDGHRLGMGAGSFSLSGIAPLLKIGASLAAGPGSFTLTGQGLGVRGGGAFGLQAGTLTLTGATPGTKQGHQLPVTAGTITLNGQTLGLILGGAFTGAVIPGSFTLTGELHGLRAGAVPAAVPGSFTLSGQGAGLVGGQRLGLVPGTLTLQGQLLGINLGEPPAASRLVTCLPVTIRLSI